MRRFASHIACLGLALLLACAASAAEANKKIRVLLITGDDVASHTWQETAPATRDILLKSGKFDVRVSEDPNILDSKTLAKNYDVIYFAIFARTMPTLSDAAKENLLSFVEAGKGFVVQHLASASYGDWPEFGKLCGRYWVMKKSGHGPRNPFEVKIVNKEHPITKGLPDFTADDELYAKLQGDEKIEVLASAASDWSKQVEPLIFVRDYGKGRVFHQCFGHDPKALDQPTIQQLIIRGTEWAATGTVK